MTNWLKLASKPSESHREYRRSQRTVERTQTGLETVQTPRPEIDRRGGVDQRGLDWVNVLTRCGVGEECLNVVATGSRVWRDTRAFETNPAKVVQAHELLGDAAGSQSTRLRLRTRKDQIQILEEIKGAR